VIGGPGRDTVDFSFAPSAVACTFSTRFVTGGFLEADGEVWDAGGRLVAQSRQLALMPRPARPEA